MSTMRRTFSIAYSFVRPSAAVPPHIQKELPPAFPWEASTVLRKLQQDVFVLQAKQEYAHFHRG